MIKEHDIVVLTEDVPEEGLTAGDVGTVVHIHNQGGTRVPLSQVEPVLQIQKYSAAI